MSQYTFSDIDPDTDTGTTLSNALNEWKDAVQSNHSGSSAPAYNTAGLMWVDTSGGTSWDLKMYDGTDNITLVTVDTSSNSASIGTIASGTIITEGSGNGTATANTDSDALIIDSNANTGLSILTDDATDASVFLGSESDNKGAYFTWNYTSKNLDIATQNSGGKVLIKSGNGVNAVFVDNDQTVGIGNTDPKGLLHLKKGSSTISSWNTTLDHFIVEGDTDVGMTVAGLNTAVLRYGFSNAGNSYGAGIEWDYDGETNGLLDITTKKSGGTVRLMYGTGSEGLRVDGTAGYVGIGQTDPKANVHIGESVNATFNALENTTDLIIGNTGAANMLIQGDTSAAIDLIDTAATVDEKRFEIKNEDGVLTIKVVTDAGVGTSILELHADTNDIYMPELANTGYANVNINTDGRLQSTNW